MVREFKNKTGYQMKPIDKFGIWTIVLGVLYFLGHLFWWWLK